MLLIMYVQQTESFHKQSLANGVQGHHLRDVHPAPSALSDGAVCDWMWTTPSFPVIPPESRYHGAGCMGESSIMRYHSLSPEASGISVACLYGSCHILQIHDKDDCKAAEFYRYGLATGISSSGCMSLSGKASA